ncbi:MAG: sigma 54-interacting transcriptional regulator [Planctomycetota bacterium]
MPIFTSEQRAFAKTVSELTFCNPFLSERIEYERKALGPDFKESLAVWNMRLDQITKQPNVDEIRRRAEALVESSVLLLAGEESATEAELGLYEDLVLFLLYYRYLDRFLETSRKALDKTTYMSRISFYKEFTDDAQRYLSPGLIRLPAVDELPHIFACFYQVRRAFYQIFNNIIGVSVPAVQIRARVWQSIFTHDMRRFRRALYKRMGNFTTLITGPSGTGKELVGRAIGLAQYIPFDPKTMTFREDIHNSFLPLNLSALAPTLMESELFGHCRGAFTGAVKDHTGRLDICPEYGVVFLDEIGEIDPSVQVKLLRVLEDRRFQRLGENSDRKFRGKILAATNRDLAKAMQQGIFREDFYYRLCSDIIELPSLAERIVDSEEELRCLVLFLAEREAPEEAPALCKEVMAWIQRRLGKEYPWPGNIRELEQCVRNVLIRKEYNPAPRNRSMIQEWTDEMQAGTLTSDEVMQRYCTWIYSRSKSYEEAARRLELDRRTVKAKIDPKWLERFTEGRMK